MTVRIREGLPSMREQVLYRRIRESIRHAKERLGLRITQFSIQREHVHLIVEAEDKEALSSGMKGLGVRIARGVNGVLHREPKQGDSATGPCGVIDCVNLRHNQV